VIKKIATKRLKNAQGMVRRIIAHYFGQAQSGKAGGSKPEIVPLAGGRTNLVFSVRDASGNFIVRLGADPSKSGAFFKEQWAVAKAREAGVPTPEILQVGTEAAPVPYMISRLSKGREATRHPERLRIVHSMGRYAAMINSIQTQGFGSTFEWCRNELSQNASWAEFLRNELKLEENLSFLAEHGMLNAPRTKKVRTTLERAARKNRVPYLNHGDLRLKNVLVDE
jgi:hygromycin-B 4-O-kinase